MSRRFPAALPPREFLPSVVALLALSVLMLSVLGLRAADARDVCADASQRAGGVVDATNALGLALVERAEAEEWYARSLATAEAEHLAATLEVESPRYEAARARCEAMTR